VPTPFRIDTSRHDDISAVALDGQVDAHTAPKFEEAIQAELSAGHRRLIVDCSKLSYISSAGLGVFMSFIEEIREQGGDIKICGVIPKVLATFEILGFQDIFDIEADVPAAVQRFRESPTREA
jgi:anti-sigma B factor antagonist